MQSRMISALTAWRAQNPSLPTTKPFAEIGAGQEVVRWFFRVGGAAGTIASGDDSWGQMVPPQVAEFIRKRGFFGCPVS